MCIELIRQMSQTGHKLHHLLPEKLRNIRQRETRLCGQLFYNYKYRTERFENSPVVSSIELLTNPLMAVKWKVFLYRILDLIIVLVNFYLF